MKAWVRAWVGIGSWIAVVCAASGCVESEPPKERVVEALEVTPPSLALVQGQVLRLEATPRDRLGRAMSNVPVTFRTSDAAVVEVDPRGWAEGIERGEAVVVASAGGHEVEVPVQVRRRVDRVAVEPNEVELIEGERLALGATPLDRDGDPVDGAPEARWSSDAPEVATVSPAGLVEARRAGLATVEAALGEGAGRAQVRVLPKTERIRLTGHAHELIEGHEQLLRAEALGRDGRPVGRQVEWRSTAPEVASVQGGRVAAHAAGEAGIVASLDGVEEVWELRVLPSISTIEVLAELDALYRGGRSQWGARLLDADGEELTGRPVHWESSDPTVAEVDGAGWVIARADGQAEISAHAEGVSGSAVARVVGEATLALGGDLRKREEPGVSFSLEAILLGPEGGPPEEPLPIRWSSTDPTVATVDDRGRVEVVALGHTFLQARAGGLVATRPLTASLRFEGIATGDAFTCGVTERGNLWCWGSNEFGQLGGGEVGGTSHLPSRVDAPAGLRFSEVTAGSAHACALTQAGEAYCWGDNRSGALHGDPSLPHVARPLPAVPGERFRWLRAGLIPFHLPLANEGAHTCGITQDGRTLCWGNGRQGQLGHGEEVASSAPVEPAGGHAFVEVHPAAGFTCGLTAAGEVFCWGHGPLGRPLEVGFLTTHFQSLVPHLSIPADPADPDWPPTFRTLAVGRAAVCGVTAEEQTYCWGADLAESLGESGYVYDPQIDAHDFLPLLPVTPAPIPWTSLALGSTASCGVDAEGELHCWGRKTWLHEPDAPCSYPRTATPSRLPPGDGPAVAVALGRDYCAEHGCRLLEDGRVQCWGDSRSGQAGVPGGLGNGIRTLYPDP